MALPLHTIARIISSMVLAGEDLTNIGLSPFTPNVQRTCTGCDTALASGAAIHRILDCYNVLQAVP